MTGIYETDEIYVIAFSNYGVSACYFIEKNDPNTMYYMSDLTSEFGITVVNCFKNNMQYTRSEGNSEAPELKTGEISVLGLKKLEHLYGKDFETFLEVTMESDGYDDIEGRGEYYLWNVYNAGKPEWYLVDMSDSAVTLRVPYVTDRSGSEQTPVYLDLRFTKDDTGEWSVGYSPAEKDEKNPYGLTLEVKDATAYSQDNSKPNNAASDEVVDFLANIEQLVNSSEQIEELKQLLLKIEGVADVQVYNSDDDSKNTEIQITEGKVEKGMVVKVFYDNGESWVQYTKQ